jgi:H+-transporting ATPase
LEEKSAKIRETAEYKELSIEHTLKLLISSTAGLTESEARQRLLKLGFNEVNESKRNSILLFMKRYWGPMPWLLELAIILSVILKHYLEAGIIFALLTINTVIGQIQSHGSQKALAALKKRLAIKARVLRDGRWLTKETKEIVPGDIISVGLGDIVPADAKVISGDLSIDQSILTGESLPVSAGESAIIYSGSIVKRGEAKCVVVNTGVTTFFGETAELVKTAESKSYQERIMLTIVRYMMFLAIVALIIVAIYAIIIGAGTLSILTFAIIFLMGAVPVALPAVLAIVEAVGAVELSKKGVLVTRLDSIEDAASIDILCLDKTGTITQNKLSVEEIIPFGNATKNEVIVMASLACQEQSKDSIDIALLSYWKSMNISQGLYKCLSFTPFEPATKRSEAIVTAEGKNFRVIKGAPQTVISRCETLDEISKNILNQKIEELSGKGYRALGIARSFVDDYDNIQFLGLISLADPPRPDTQIMIEGIEELGVKPLMLTGDNIAIAKEIAIKVGIGNRIIRMDDIRNLDETEQAKIINESDGFAEIYPEDKYKIVKLLQSKGHMVGMTGDGVNDAPALKQAELGIAVSSSTDVAKASASMVLTEPGLAVVIDALKISRNIYQRMLTWVINKVTKVIQVIGLLAIGFFWFHDLVVSLLGMTLLIFANDFVTMSLATDNVAYTANPNKWNIKNITYASLLVGALLVMEGALALFIGSHYFHLQLAQLQTFTVLMLIFTSQFRVYIVRERKYFWSSLPGRELAITTIAALVVFSFLGVYGLIIPSLPLYQVLFILVYSAAFTLAIDFPKYEVFKKFGL